MICFPQFFEFKAFSVLSSQQLQRPFRSFSLNETDDENFQNRKMTNFTVQRLRFWEYFKNQDDIDFKNLPRKYKEYEDLIKTVFFRFFGIERENLGLDYDLNGFDRGVRTFVIDILKWKKKCKGYSSQFEGKPFMKLELTLEKTMTEEEPEDVVEDMEADIEEEQEEVVEDIEVPFRDKADSTQRKISAEIRELYEPDAILKVKKNIFRVSKTILSMMFSF